MTSLHILVIFYIYFMISRNLYTFFFVTLKLVKKQTLGVLFGVVLLIITLVAYLEVFAREIQNSVISNLT